MTPRDGVGGYHPAMVWSAHRSLMLLSAALLATVLAGCTREGEPSPADAPAEGGLAALPEPFEGAWAGVLPCADCEGIDVVLELQRESGAAGRYRLVETYLGAVDAVGFEIAGEWREEDCGVGEVAGSCLVLLESGQRWFRHADGSLQAVDAEGRALDPEGARLQRR
jgi:copper homeostasis protein (lipoprotein)